MSTLEDVKARVERTTGIWRPSRAQALEAVRTVRGKTHRFAVAAPIPNNPDLPLVIYKRALKFAKKFDPAAVIEEVFEANGWGDGWRDSIYDWMHFHSRTHEVLGIAKGRARVRFGGDNGREIAIAAGDVIILPAGTGHQKITASGDLLVVGAYPRGGSYDERKVASPSALKTIRRVPRPKTDPLYGKGSGIMKLWRDKTRACATGRTTMSKPVRLQLSRKKGFNLQAHSRRLNGLPAVVVSRPARWSNPWPIGAKEGKRILSRDEVIDRYAGLIAGRHEEIRQQLAGKNLACWCKKGLRCHADLLLRIANRRPRSKPGASAVTAEQKPNQNKNRNRHAQDPQQ